MTPPRRNSSQAVATAFSKNKSVATEGTGGGIPLLPTLTFSSKKLRSTFILD